MRLVVCAAFRHKSSGRICCGVRHGNCVNALIDFGIDLNPSNEYWDLGFVDQDQNFLTRAEAWKIAAAAGQIRRPTTFERAYENCPPGTLDEEGLLFSENLY